jgi:outer membrane protein OmpA-like peptidoglycan-associated protein
MLGEYLVIYDGTTQGVLAAPTAGWPRPGARVQAEGPIGPPPAPTAVPAGAGVTEIADQPMPAPVPATRRTTPAVAVADAEPENAPPPPQSPSLDGVRPVMPAPRIVRTESAGDLPDLTPTIADAAAPAVEIELASVDTSALTGGSCSKAERYNVLGFAENSNEVTPRVVERLKQILGDIGGQRCVIHVTGYSDTRGSYATNALFAVERAQNVLAFMRANGLQYLDVNATGAGETNRFGTTPATNRRVVITVRP